MRSEDAIVRAGLVTLPREPGLKTAGEAGKGLLHQVRPLAQHPPFRDRPQPDVVRVQPQIIRGDG